MAWIRKRRAERARKAEEDAAAAAAAEAAERSGAPALARGQSSPPPCVGSPSDVSIVPPPAADESAVADDSDDEAAAADQSDELTAEERAEEERLTREAKISTISRSAAAERFKSRSVSLTCSSLAHDASGSTASKNLSCVRSDCAQHCAERQEHGLTSVSRRQCRASAARQRCGLTFIWYVSLLDPPALAPRMPRALALAA